VDVAGIEPATPCLQSRRGKTLKCFVGVAYTDHERNFRSPNIPKLYRISAAAKTLGGHLMPGKTYRDLTAEERDSPTRLLVRRMHFIELVCRRNCGRFPSAVNDGRGCLFRPVQTQHRDKLRFGSREPIRFFHFSGRVRLQVEVNGTIGIGYKFIASTERVAIEPIRNKEIFFVIHGQ